MPGLGGPGRRERLRGSEVRQAPQAAEPDASLRLGQRLGVRGQGAPPPDLLLGSTALPEASHTTGDASVLGKGRGHRGSPSAA